MVRESLLNGFLVDCELVIGHCLGKGSSLNIIIIF